MEVDWCFYKHDLDYARLDPGQLKACLGAGPADELVNNQQEFALQQPWITVDNFFLFFVVIIGLLGR